ncbi:putative colanic acid biosynthesis UDP-glucose lipid carrier transferase [Chitinophaga niastensis]|uniref:Putative colanic acid biosynthesis UDP-glucose lipid carrier transferase n=1 Tax=Chitinophaga niastensis TaxID=536980 RepID=A0A2P8HM69_CHINA|nr:undecaprenyl-phosphate glucose phosphotransferase [Chitinophaga niastensis]PSL47314.1 putative colanic acid biosynthesis UDP-glucose lipid carrier transferase [Chitinophaga niastensis]
MKQDVHASQFLRLVIDYGVLVIAFILTREYIAAKGDVFFSPLNWLLLFISWFVWTVTGTAMHLYEDYKSRFSFEFVAILKTVLLHISIFTFLFFYFFKFYPYPRTFTLLYTFYIFAGTTTIKYIVKKILLRLRHKDHNIKNVLIVGAGETALNFYNTITSNNHLGYKCVGFVNDHRSIEMNDHQYLGKISELRSILEDSEIDDVVVALPETAKEDTERIIMTSERAAKRVRIIVDCHRYCTSTVSMNLLGTFPLVSIRSSPLDDPARQWFKRLFDICFTLILFTVFSWLFVIIGILIKLSSKGPILFKQERWGHKNKKIICYKFRSMVVQKSEVDSEGHFIQATRNDARVTFVGRFLRKTNLDELPQCINVLLGNMSFVGPRPHATPLHFESKDIIQHYMLRQLVKPGITGWAQVNGCRGETRHSGQMQQRVNLDIWYIENYSFWLDCQILFQTLMNMIKGDKNAY